MKQIQETYIFENDHFLFKLVSSHVLVDEEPEKVKYKTKGDASIEMEMELPSTLSGPIEVVQDEQLTLTIIHHKGGTDIYPLRPEDFDGLYTMLGKTIKPPRGMY